MHVCLIDSPRGSLFFQAVLHTLNKYAERNQSYQWIFNQDYDGKGKVMNYNNA
jgi:hypothetical protein